MGLSFMFIEGKGMEYDLLQPSYSQVSLSVIDDDGRAEIASIGLVQCLCPPTWFSLSFWPAYQLVEIVQSKAIHIFAH